MPALPIIPLFPFPNVPKVPGVPAVPRSLTFPTPAGTLVLSSDGLGFSQGQAPPVWGVFDDETGDNLLAPDSIIEFSARGEGRVSSFPIEGGLFSNYNKVKVPGENRVTMTKSGPEADRADFLDLVRGLVDGLKLCAVITPTATFSSVNATHFDYAQRRDKGANMITVELWFEEIRVAPAAAYDTAQEPQGADMVNDGAVRPQTPTARQAAIMGPVA